MTRQETPSGSSATMLAVRFSSLKVYLSLRGGYILGNGTNVNSVESGSLEKFGRLVISTLVKA